MSYDREADSACSIDRVYFNDFHRNYFQNLSRREYLLESSRPIPEILMPYDIETYSHACHSFVR
jgi:hypothetical protein